MRRPQAAISHSIPTISLPQLSPMHPLVTFPLDKVMIRTRLNSTEDGRSYIKLFNKEGHEVYHIDDSHRYWVAALVIVGRMMADNGSYFAHGKFD